MKLSETKDRLKNLRDRIANNPTEAMPQSGDAEALDGAIGILDRAGVLFERPISVRRRSDGGTPSEGDFVEYRCPRCRHIIATGFYYPPINGVIRQSAFCRHCGQALSYDRPMLGEEDDGDGGK